LAQKRKRAIAIKLANLGLTEVQTYPFVSAEIMKLLGFTGDRAKTFKIANPMSEETPFLRTHLTPGLLLTAQRNINRGAKSIAIFELGSIFRNLTELKPEAVISTDKRPTGTVISEIYNSVPKQPLHAGGVLGGQIENAGWWGKGRAVSWSDAVDMAATLLDEMGATYKVSNTELAPWHPGRCAEFQIDGKPVAHAGELHPRIISELGLPERTSAFVVVLDAVPFREQVSAPKVWTMPAAIQDISLIVAETVSSADVSEALKTGAGDLLESITLFDRYDQVGEGKISLAFTLVFRAEDRTLTAEEVSLLRESAGSAAVKACGAVIRTA
jgi:phenylalanyl-tRNA synthetase beta chain